MKVSFFKETKSPKIIFREQAYFDILKMMGSTFAKDKEFMFYGFVEAVVNNQYIVDKFMLIPNMKNSAAYCESDDEKYMEFMQQIPIKDRVRIRIHAHSHVNMATGPSGTDNTEFMEKANAISNYYIQLIVNHKEANTVNICDVATGIKYEEVPQYIQVGDYIYDKTKKKIFSWNEETKVIGDEVNISDGNYTIENNQIVFNEVLKYDFKSNTFILDGERLMLVPNQPSVYYISDEEVKEVNDLFDKLIKKTTYTAPSTYNYNQKSTYPYSNDYDDYYSQYYYGGGNKVWDPTLKRYVDKPATPAKEDPKIDTDDKLIIEYYKKSLKGAKK